MVNLRMINRGAIRQWQAARIEDSHLGSKMCQQTRGFQRQKAAVGTLT
jgi:hypothetical protein